MILLRLLKVIDDRYKEKKPLIFTTNIEEQDWPEFLGDLISTSAILDRIFHHSVIVKMMVPAIVNTRENSCRRNMVKRKQMMQKQLKTNSPDNDNEKVLNILASFL